MLENDSLICKNAHFASLFKTEPHQLYICWAAAMQIQFNVSDLEQSFAGSTEQWAKSYLPTFVQQAKNRAAYMIEKFVRPFEKYID